MKDFVLQEGVNQQDVSPPTSVMSPIMLSHIYVSKPPSEGLHKVQGIRICFYRCLCQEHTPIDPEAQDRWRDPSPHINRCLDSYHAQTMSGTL